MFFYIPLLFSVSTWPPSKFSGPQPFSFSLPGSCWDPRCTTGKWEHEACSFCPWEDLANPLYSSQGHCDATQNHHRDGAPSKDVSFRLEFILPFTLESRLSVFALAAGTHTSPPGGFFPDPQQELSHFLNPCLCTSGLTPASPALSPPP